MDLKNLFRLEVVQNGKSWPRVASLIPFIGPRPWSMLLSDRFFNTWKNQQKSTHFRVDLNGGSMGRGYSSEKKVHLELYYLNQVIFPSEFHAISQNLTPEKIANMALQKNSSVKALLRSQIPREIAKNRNKTDSI